jgi:photosystem II stability/assembly factor-like uncharacterized protein
LTRFCLNGSQAACVAASIYSANKCVAISARSVSWSASKLGQAHPCAYRAMNTRCNTQILAASTPVVKVLALLAVSSALHSMVCGARRQSQKLVPLVKTIYPQRLPLRSRR